MLLPLKASLVLAASALAVAISSPAFGQTGQPAPQLVGDPPEGWSRHGDTGVTPIGDSMFAFGVQYRLVYDGSNLPGPAGTTPDNPAGYDVFRQRVRLNFEFAPNDSVGAFVQAEFRGGWGGGAPGSSDPRNAQPTLNPFNRIGDRGLRYTYLFWKPSKTQQVMAGILPYSDEFGDTLFSADWDWNVGGIGWLGSADRSRWRLAALSMVEGVGASQRETIGKNGTMVLADYSRTSASAAAVWSIDWGAHLYGLIVQETLPLGGTRDFWLGPDVSLRKDDFVLRLFGILNTGDLGIGVVNADGTVKSGFSDADARSHTGAAFRFEAAKRVVGINAKAQFVHTTGDGDGQVDKRFDTPMGLFGTSGYWGYTHIFTANGPSDVNDLGVDIGNRGAGLTTAQAMGSVPLHARFNLDVSTAWFRASQPRNSGRDMGYEVAANLRTHLSGPLNLDSGVAVAHLGRFFGTDPKKTYEVFSRLQLQY
jgi:hypothetical protein